MCAESKTEYIVHWTTDEPCHECNTRFAIACADNAQGCGVPRMTVDHYEFLKSLDLALKTANVIGEPAKQSDQEWQLRSIIGGTPPSAKHGTVVAIYEARKLPIKLISKEISIPQPAKKETRVTVELEK